MAWIVAVVGQQDTKTGASALGAGAGALGWLRNAVLALFAAALAAGTFLPVYTDEIGWRFQERAGLDGVDKLFNDMCGPNTLARPPFFMMPVRYYSAFFNTSFADPFYIRVSGVLYAAAWFALLLALIRRISADRPDRAVLQAAGVGLMCLGTLPLQLIWSRPEQPILLAVTMALVIALSGGEERVPSSAASAWRRSIAILLLVVIAFSYHLKALFLLPVFLACLFFAARGTRANLPRLVVGALLVAAAGWSAHYWIHRLQCPNDAELLMAYARNNTGVALTSSRNLTEFLAALKMTIGNAGLLEYFGLPAPRVLPMSQWMEPGQISEAHSFLWFEGMLVAWGCATVAALVCICLGAWAAWRERRLDARLIFAVLLLGTVLAWSATQAIRNVYEAAFVLPLVMLAIVLALAARGRGQGIGACVTVLTVGLGLAAFVSVGTLAAIYQPSFVRASGQNGFIRDQERSVSIFGYQRLKPDILGAARQCGIGDPAKASNLLVDDVTYFAFMKSRLPQHELGVFATWKGSIADPVAYLKSRRSDGMIIGCHWLPDDLRRRARRQGRFCCLGPPNW